MSNCPHFTGGTACTICQKLTLIEDAVRNYHSELDARRHGGVAADRLVKKVQNILGMGWHAKNPQQRPLLDRTGD